MSKTPAPKAASSTAAVVVRLDDPKFPAGPATVVAHVASVGEFFAMSAGRDGARDRALRLWWGGHAPIGARLVLK